MPINNETIDGESVLVWSDPERQIALNALVTYNNWISDNLQNPIYRAISRTPDPISEALEKTTDIRKEISESSAVKEESLPILKSAVLMARQIESESVESRTRQSLDPDTIVALRLELAIYDQILEHEALSEKSAHVLPRITDYLTIHSAEQALSHSEKHPLLDRKADDKFGILLAPDLFIPDLTHFREVCGLRNVPLCVAYIDVDDFKSFNTKYTENRVDQYLLPKFMGAIESHMFSHGHAYRYGGDEYIMVMPNRSLEQAIAHLEHLQSRIAELDYFGIAEKPTVSIGVIEIDDSIYKSNSEIERLAIEAKNKAKENGGNTIAYFDHGSVDPSSIEMIEK